MTPSLVSSADQLVERAAELGVEARGRLVEQQQPRPAEQRLGQAEPLPHALGVGADATAGGRGEADALEQRLGGASGQPLEPGIEGQYLAAGHRGIEGDGLGQEAQLEPRLSRRPPKSGPHPESSTVPALGRTSPSSSFISVVLPAPLWPTSARHSPGRPSRLTAVSAVSAP